MKIIQTWNRDKTLFLWHYRWYAFGFCVWLGTNQNGSTVNNRNSCPPLYLRSSAMNLNLQNDSFTFHGLASLSSKELPFLVSAKVLRNVCQYSTHFACVNFDVSWGSILRRMSVGNIDPSEIEEWSNPFLFFSCFWHLNLHELLWSPAARDTPTLQKSPGKFRSPFTII